MTGRRVVVRLDGRLAGVLEEIGERAQQTRFTYDAAWLAFPEATPISLTMPLRAEPYVSRGLHPFFENLLPEGWLLELTTQKLKIPKDDAFGLLAATCVDCIGAVEIVAGIGDGESGAAVESAVAIEPGAPNDLASPLPPVREPFA